MTADDVAVLDQQCAKFIEAMQPMHEADGVRSTAEAVVDAAMAVVPGAIEVGVALMRRRGNAEMVAATSEAVRVCDQRQRDLGQGPFHVLQDGQLASWGAACSKQWRKWGTFAAEQTRARSVMCVRLVARRTVIGALYVYASGRELMDVRTRQRVMLLAEHAAAALVNAREIHTLRRAVLSRTTVATAVGILMARYRLDDERAFELLRRWSSHRNEKLRVVAQEVVRRQIAHPAGSIDAGAPLVEETPQLTGATVSGLSERRTEREREKVALRAG